MNGKCDRCQCKEKKLNGLFVTDIIPAIARHGRVLRLIAEVCDQCLIRLQMEAGPLADPEEEDGYEEEPEPECPVCGKPGTLRQHRACRPNLPTGYHRE
jgi:hypothetical protein